MKVTDMLGNEIKLNLQTVEVEGKSKKLKVQWNIEPIQGFDGLISQMEQIKAVYKKRRIMTVRDWLSVQRMQEQILNLELKKLKMYQDKLDNLMSEDMKFDYYDSKTFEGRKYDIKS